MVQRKLISPNQQPGAVIYFDLKHKNTGKVKIEKKVSYKQIFIHRLSFLILSAGFKEKGPRGMSAIIRNKKQTNNGIVHCFIKSAKILRYVYCSVIISLVEA